MNLKLKKHYCEKDYGDTILKCVLTDKNELILSIFTVPIKIKLIDELEVNYCPLCGRANEL